jgi:hypothetical protein
MPKCSVEASPSAAHGSGLLVLRIWALAAGMVSGALYSKAEERLCPVHLCKICDGGSMDRW